ncbi:hypothetical protein GYB22_05330 [bacterium]|nr:hypothetical protein [bacterium]
MLDYLQKHIFTLILCILCSFKSTGQELIRFQNISVEDGLSMGTVTGVQKDTKGFIWIATAEGLHRYDGKHFRIFKHIDGVQNSLSDSYIRTLLAYGNYLILGTNSGTVDVMDINTYEIKTFRPSDIDPSFDYPIGKLISFEGLIYIGTEGDGLWTLDLGRDKLEHFAVADSIKTITDLEEDRGELLICTPSEIYRSEEDGLELVYSTESIQISSITRFRERFIIGTNDGAWSCNLDFSEPEELELPPKKRRLKGIIDIVANTENVWLATHGGLLKYDGINMSLYKSDVLRPYSLINNQINCLFLDNSSILWVGTIAGISRYAAKLQKFGLIQYFDYQGENYNNIVYYIYSDYNLDVWIGTLSGGIIKLNRNHEISDVFPVIKDGAAETRSVRCIYRDSRNNLWIGTRDEGLFLFDSANRSFKQVIGKGEGRLSNPVIRAIYEDSKGRLWIGTANGLNLFNYETRQFQVFRAEPNSATNNSIYQITEIPGSNKLILASFRGGIQIFNPETSHFLSMKHHPQDSTSLSNNNVMCMAWWNSDTLLVGTYGGGMNILDMKTKRFSHVTEKNGLVNNAVYGIVKEGNGEIWLSTNDGLVLYNLYEHNFINFKPVHYLQSTEYNEGAFGKSQSGTIYFGGVNGLNYFKPEDIAYDTTAAPLYITAIRGNYTQQKDNRIDLSFLSSRLEIDFMALDYVNPDGVKYKYKMNGYDQDWVEPGISNTAVYPRLSPGSYVFEVVAEDEFGHWSSVPINLEVHVRPPFYQRWWFIALIIIAALGIIFGIFKFRTSEIERTYKHQLVDSELRALRSQMNPHFIFNSLNSIQYFILKKQPQEAYTYLSKFASLMRKILQNSRLKYISVEDEIEWLELYLEMEKLRMDNNLEYTFDTTRVKDPSNTFIPTMLIQPYVENSIIHGLLSKQNDRKISIAFSLHGNHVLCVVEDNGIGREASREMNEKRTRKHQSAGMELTRKRLEILSEGKGEFDVQIEDLFDGETPAGTRVSIVVPLIEKEEA